MRSMSGDLSADMISGGRASQAEHRHPTPTQPPECVRSSRIVAGCRPRSGVFCVALCSLRSLVCPCVRVRLTHPNPTTTPVHACCVMVCLRPVRPLCAVSMCALYHRAGWHSTRHPPLHTGASRGEHIRGATPVEDRGGKIAVCSLYILGNHTQTS